MKKIRRINIEEQTYYYVVKSDEFEDFHDINIYIGKKLHRLQPDKSGIDSNNITPSFIRRLIKK
jgi:hypothetical protein